MLKYMCYSNNLKALDSCSRVRDMSAQYHSAQQRKMLATKMLGDLW